MTIEIQYESDGMKLSALIITGDLVTHSAMQDIPKEEVQKVKNQIQFELDRLIRLGTKYKKP